MKKDSRLDLSKIDVEDFLGKLGVQNIKVKGDEVFYSCPFEGHATGDSNPSASMQQGSTMFKCFACGSRGTAINFLADFEKISPIEAKKWLRREFFGGYNVPDGPFVEHIRGIIQTVDEPISRQRVPPDREFIRSTEVDWHGCAAADPADPQLYGWEKYLLNRGFDPDHLESWNIGYDVMSHRVTIPIWYEGQIVGFKARAWEPNVRPRYKVLGGPPYPFDTYDTSSFIYGLEYASRPSRPAQHILCEGELNALAMWQMGFHGACGISGKHLSEKQARLIVKHFSRITILMDEEKDALAAAEIIGNRIPVRIVRERGFDPADMLITSNGDDVIGEYIDAAVPAQLARLPV